MKRFVEGLDRGQSTLFPASLDDYVTEDNPVRAVDVFVDGLDLDKLGFVGVQPLETGRPSYHPGIMLKLYIYGYLNQVPSSRRLERECQRNIEMIWLTGQLAPDFKTIADFRKDNGKAIREVCREFVALCRKLDLFSTASVAIDGSKFKAVNARDKNFTEAKMRRRLERIDESIARYLSQLETADRHGDAVPEAKVSSPSCCSMPLSGIASFAASSSSQRTAIRAPAMPPLRRAVRRIQQNEQCLCVRSRTVPVEPTGAGLTGVRYALVAAKFHGAVK
jgi:transposase